jgi:hypothetical protein
MTQIAELGTPTARRWRQVKFTPERIQQIRNLLERGKSREEIAETFPEPSCFECSPRVLNWSSWLLCPLC